MRPVVMRQNRSEWQHARVGGLRMNGTRDAAKLTCPRLMTVLTGMTALLAIAPVVQAQTPPLRAIVNSNQDGPVQADEGLTLREAILLMNGALSLEQLSAAEQVQVSTLPAESNPRIDFNLPAGDTTIRLVEPLPPVERSGLAIDATTQPGYAASRPVINELPTPVPVVAITPAAGKDVWRGFTVTADFVRISGFSLYGFTSTKGQFLLGWLESTGFTASTPPADIFIGHRLPPPNTSKQRPPANFAPYYPDDAPPKGVVIENNWLGMPPGVDPAGTPTVPPTRSAFGVSVFNATGTIIQRNWIANHDGSAIITSVQATEMNVAQNVMTGNGVAGMPDAIRLEGNVAQSRIASNLICGNDGSGVYLFKPAGATFIEDNQIVYNGRRFRRAAVYLMGNDHVVKGNEIRYQTGPGVVAASYPETHRALIQANKFSSLEGLSIDLVTRVGAGAGTGVQDYQRGDGANPPRDSANRRKETGNAAINAPIFVSREFFLVGSAPVQVFGKADPGSQIDIYRLARQGADYEPLAEPIATTETDAQGKFSVPLEGLRTGDAISAIATDPRYGTSEPARTAVVRSLDAEQAPLTPQSPSSVPRCVTPVAQEPQIVPPGPATLRVPNVIHFALDKATISPATARVLNEVASVLRDNPTIVVEIVGHTDPRATDVYNLDLGMRRALATRNYLLQQGVAPERLTIRSLGERQRLSSGQTRLDFARDRRVQLIYQDARNIEVIIQETDLQLEP